MEVKSKFFRDHKNSFQSQSGLPCTGPGPQCRRLDFCHQARSWVTTSTRKAMNLNGDVRFIDWPNRYFHVDQVLEKPGPRTDEGFSAGDVVSNKHNRKSQH